MADEKPSSADVDSDQAVFEAAKDKSLRVGRLVVAGLNRTKVEVVDRELRGVREAGTLDEIKDVLLESYENLVGLDIFDAVDIVIDRGDAAKTCNVVAQFQEKNLLRLHTGTYVQGTEGSIEASLNLTNPLGYAEQVSVGAEYGSQSTNVYSLGLAVPRPWGNPALLDLRIHQLFHNYQPWSSYTELLRGGMVTLAADDGRHALGYELGWRRLAAPQRTASRAVTTQLGDTVKSAVKYVFRQDTFDDVRYPTSGWGVRSTTEVAGLGQEAGLLRFVKQHVTGQAVFPISGATVLVLGAEAGLLLPWSSRGLAAAGRSHISERFYLGGVGAGALRGFAQKGVGPMDARRPAAGGGEASPRPGRQLDALGGDAFVSILAALRFRLPSQALDQSGVHGQTFLNGGSLVAVSNSLPSSLHQLATTLRWSVGAGIVWPTQLGRLELNVCRIIAAQPTDVTKHGIQFGFSGPL